MADHISPTSAARQWTTGHTPVRHLHTTSSGDYMTATGSLYQKTKQPRTKTWGYTENGRETAGPRGTSILKKGRVVRGVGAESKTDLEIKRKYTHGNCSTIDLITLCWSLFLICMTCIWHKCARKRNPPPQILWLVYFLNRFTCQCRSLPKTKIKHKIQAINIKTTRW